MCSREWVSLCSCSPNLTSFSAELADDVIGSGSTSAFLSTGPAVGDVIGLGSTSAFLSTGPAVSDVIGSGLSSVSPTEGLTVGDDNVPGKKTAGFF